MNHARQTRIALLLPGKLAAALRANDPDAFRGMLSEDMQELGVTDVEELLLKLNPALSSVKWSQVRGYSAKRLQHMKRLLAATLALSALSTGAIASERFQYFKCKERNPGVMHIPRGVEGPGKTLRGASEKRWGLPDRP